MDGLAEFENKIALEKAEREKSELYKHESRRRHHHYHHHHHHHREHEHRHETFPTRHKDSKSGSRHRPTGSPVKESNHNDKRQRHKRPRYSDAGDEDDPGDAKHLKLRDPEEDSLATDNDISKIKATRDSWMTDPSGIGIDYVHRRRSEMPSVQNTKSPQQWVSERELNKGAFQQVDKDKNTNQSHIPSGHDVNYVFGDEGSQWRMTKLKGVYTVAKQINRPVDEVALERYGNLREFDDAREEESEIERRRLYGKGYVGKEKPTGDLYRKRIEKEDGNNDPGREDEGARVLPSVHESLETAGDRPSVPIDQTTLNRLRARLMKAKLKNSPDVEQLETEYSQAMAAFSSSRDDDASPALVLDAAHSRMLTGNRGEVKAVNTKRGRERGLVETNDDMSIDDMLREERRTRRTAEGEGLQLAERIAKDAKFDDDLEYLDENAEKLAKRVYKSDVQLKGMAVQEFSKMNRIFESCPLCHHEDRQQPQNLPIAPIAALATRVFLTLSTEPELTGTEGGAVIVPIDHHTNLLECNDDEWEEIRNFMKSLTRLYHDQGRDVIFYENAVAPHRRMHAALVAIPIPYDLGATAPAYFREAMLSADEEWAQHKKIIDTAKRAREGLGKHAFRKSIAKEMPYFHAWFSLDGGLGHIVEDASQWPKGDLFAREIIGGMLDVDVSIIKRQGRWVRDDARLSDFKKRWKKFDWTRILTEGLV